MISELIALLISTGVTALLTIVFCSTKSGKKAVAEFNGTTKQTNFALRINSLTNKKANVDY